MHHEWIHLLILKKINYWYFGFLDPIKDQYNMAIQKRIQNSHLSWSVLWTVNFGNTDFIKFRESGNGSILSGSVQSGLKLANLDTNYGSVNDAFHTNLIIWIHILDSNPDSILKLAKNGYRIQNQSWNLLKMDPDMKIVCP